MPRPTTAVFLLQGILMLAVGFYALFDPEGFVSSTSDNIQGRPTQMVHSLSMMSLSLGTLFLAVASHTPIHHRVLISCVPLRILAAAVFWHDGPATHGVALYEVLWAVIDAVAIKFT